jgi:hypothetical protein
LSPGLDPPLIASLIPSARRAGQYEGQQNERYRQVTTAAPLTIAVGIIEQFRPQARA